ncbi:site-specific integrase [Clostridium perfringens]|uniref:tyrosine-type recombinase/integrase n=1 Tax=Clostridium perfringens TaxID=1502 RepID=UPI0013E38C0E|nr:site-specific integrase [Clostridium perfringens]EGT3619591.1 site-specific integrase [Clostridium perfringens]MCX0398603.1 site-specific integrase [Clostridium perfringens]NGS95802.1 site-specific integrase [Clostridium perfringens]
MARKTFRKTIVTPELLDEINPKNKKLVQRFLKEKNTRCSDKTIINYTSDLNIFFCWNVLENDNKFFVDLKKLELSDFFAFAVDELKWGSARFSRMRSALSSLSEFIERFYDEDYPKFKNIVLKAIELMPKSARRRKTVLSEKQIDDLLNHLKNEINRPQEACLLALAICSGARKSELLRFDLDLIDENNTAFDGLFIETKEKIKTKGFTKEGKLLYKYIIKDLFMPYYNDWLKIRKEIMEKNNVEEHNKLFIKNNGQPAKVSTLDSWIQKWSDYLKEDVYLHSLRHYTCTYLSKIGLESELVIEIFGWSSSDMYKIYNDLSAKDRKWKGTEKLKQHLSSIS